MCVSRDACNCIQLYKEFAKSRATEGSCYDCRDDRTKTNVVSGIDFSEESLNTAAASVITWSVLLQRLVPCPLSHKVRTALKRASRDLSHMTVSHVTHRRWVQALQEECFRQDIVEREMGKLSFTNTAVLCKWESLLQLTLAAEAWV